MIKYKSDVFDWLIKIIGYALILVFTSMIFNDTIYIDKSYYGMWVFVLTILIFVLNKTLKPLLVWLTIPITGITLGLFYPFINLIILKIASFLMGDHFSITGIWFALFASILISILNILLDRIIFRKIKRKES